MKTILRATRCVAVVVALFTVGDVGAEDEHGVNHYILDLIRNIPLILPAADNGAGASAAGVATTECTFKCPWGVIEIYSNADGSIQFLILISAQIDKKYGFLDGKTLIASSGSAEHTLTFPTDKVYAGDKPILVATQGFADLSVVKPDFIVPNGFLFLENGSLRLRDEPWFEGDSVKYDALPIDGVYAFFPDAWGDSLELVGPASATNSAGQIYDFPWRAPPNYQGTWWNAAEPGWGIGLTHQGDRIFATWFTYDPGGNPLWLSMPASRDASAGNIYTGPLYINMGAPLGTTTGATETKQIGTGSLEFSDADSARFSYAIDGLDTIVRQTKSITRYKLDPGPQPACIYDSMPLFKYASIYQGLWWDPADAGKGMAIVHQHREFPNQSRIFATWYTYDTAGKPVWLSALLASMDDAWWIFAGPLMRTHGPRFDSYDPSAVAPAQVVGAVQIVFIGAEAYFTYSTSGNGGLPIVTEETKVMTRYLFAAPAGTVCY